MQGWPSGPHVGRQHGVQLWAGTCHTGLGHLEAARVAPDVGCLRYMPKQLILGCFYPRDPL